MVLHAIVINKQFKNIHILHNLPSINDKHNLTMHESPKNISNHNYRLRN